ncbi:hypothetical protein MKY48_05400 [Paenibacillus sp. FSL W8-0187]|uniref:hypothetical protein n=1 Tax=Paenibacillus sp. FSL W8-0187 TaxID=2921710 RepID=UPI0030DB39D1
MHLKKEEVCKDILNILKKQPSNSVDSIQGHFFNELQERNLVGTVKNGTTTTYGIPMPQSDIMLINEVIYDLIVERVITPGRDSYNKGMPYFSVTNNEKLEEMIKSLQ